MCGILCGVAFSGKCAICNSSQSQELSELNKIHQRRGPDTSSELCISAIRDNDSSSSTTALTTPAIHLVGHVLWTNGSRCQKQPYCAETAYMLFNGDIYSFGDDQIGNEKENDGLRLFEIFQNSIDIPNFLECISKLRGPYAFVYLDTVANNLWFARDFFGRESLVVSFEDNDTIYISSVSNFNTLFEIPTSGVFCLNLLTKKVTLYGWDCHDREGITVLTKNFGDLLQVNGFDFCTEGNLKVSCVQTFLKTIHDESTSILTQLENIADPGIADPQSYLEIVSEILKDKVDEFLFHLRNSVRQRVEVKPPVCKNCSNDTICSHSKISILFSGGLDSTVLAFLAAEVLTPGESMDLLNVAFFQDDKIQLDHSIPDRQTGLESYKILRQIFEPKGITLNFIPVNISKSTLSEMRERRIRTLISPLRSVLDDSVGCCLWFATAGSEGQGQGSSSPARIVILGSGADELLGGYGRHRSAFDRGGWEGLRREMQFEIDRISVRNMGRDNRIVSDHGVAPRIPFLDERLVTFLTQECDVWVKCCPLKCFGEKGLGEKILLRAAAVKLFGTQNSHLALFPKRAMQFGSRIAKLENSKEKGGDECKRLTLNSLQLG